MFLDRLAGLLSPGTDASADRVGVLALGDRKLYLTPASIHPTHPLANPPQGDR